MLKKIFIKVFLFFLFNTGYSQLNLIPNPSFEVIADCPDAFTAGQVELASPWYNAIWTPDLLNICDGSGPGTTGVPVNGAYCFQYPRTGNGYAGFIVHFTVPKAAEYMGVPLLEKLKKNKQYYISFYINKRNCANPDICYSDGVALAFSDTLFQKQLAFGEEYVPDHIPVVQNPSGNMLTDTLNWTEISGCYTAKGTEAYAIIGNFRSFANTNSTGCVGATGSYYYLDDVGVYEFDPLPDTLLLCGEETKEIGQSFLNGTYQWDTGATDSTIVVSEAGRYIVTVDLGKCSLSDTVIVIKMDEVIDYLFTDTLICSGEELQLTIPVPGDFTWFGGEQGNSIIVNEANIYSVSISNECGLFSHTFEVESEICACNVFIPNAFSPNYDGVNDYLECFVSCDFPYKIIRFQVFDRWGELVYASYSTDQQTISWDGTLKGKTLVTGVYVWIFEYEYTRNGKNVNKRISGDVTIVK